MTTYACVNARVFFFVHIRDRRGVITLSVAARVIRRAALFLNLVAAFVYIYALLLSVKQIFAALIKFTHSATIIFLELCVQSI